MNARRIAAALVLLAALTFAAPPGAAAFHGGNTGPIATQNCTTTNTIPRLTTASTTAAVLDCTPMTSDGTNVTLGSGALIIPQGTVAATVLRHSGAAAGSGWFAGGAANRWRLANAGTGMFEIDPDNTFVQIASNWSLRWRSSNDLAAGDTDLILGRAGAANLLHGGVAANPPIAQTLSVQNASGTDIAGANWTYTASQGTGTGAGGSLIFRTAAAGTTGSSLNALATAFTISTPQGAIAAAPATQTIAAGNTVTADACGSIKRVTATGAVTTDTINTFTAPAAANAGCIMSVVNVGANAITLDVNANFFAPGAVDVVLGANDAIVVGSTGAGGAWYALSALVAN